MVLHLLILYIIYDFKKLNYDIPVTFFALSTDASSFHISPLKFNSTRFSQSFTKELHFYESAYVIPKTTCLQYVLSHKDLY